MCAISISGQLLSKRGTSCRIDLQSLHVRTRPQAVRIELTNKILLSLPPVWRRNRSTPDTSLWSTKKEPSQAFQLSISQRCAVVQRPQIRPRGFLHECMYSMLRRGHLDASQRTSGRVEFAVDFISRYQAPRNCWGKIQRYCICDPYTPEATSSLMCLPKRLP